MNQEIHIPCHPTEPVEPPVLVVADALARFEREAKFGVCDTGRYRASYFEWGAGPPLVFVHGLCDDARSFTLPISVLSRYFRCVAYDLPAGGNDGARLGRYRHQDYVDDLFGLLDHLGIDRPNLYGSSFGSTIVLKALHAAPNRFPRAVLQGGFARRPLAPAEVLLARLARSWPWPMGRLPFREALLRHSHFHAFIDREPAAWENYVRRVNTPPMAAVARRGLIVHAADLRPTLPDIQQPVLLVCGSGDPLVSRACEDELLHGLPNAARAVINGCGHYPYFSHPEVMAELILRFLTPVPCEGSALRYGSAGKCGDPGANSDVATDGCHSQSADRHRRSIIRSSPEQLPATP